MPEPEPRQSGCPDCGGLRGDPRPLRGRHGATGERCEHPCHTPMLGAGCFAADGGPHTPDEHGRCEKCGYLDPRQSVADGDDEKRDRWHSPDCPVVRNAHLPSEQPCTCSLLVADGGEGKPRLFVHECSQCGHGVPCQHRSEAAALRSQLENAVADRDAHRHLSEKNEARLSSAESEVARLREALERIAYPPLDAQGTPIDTPGDAEGIARAALGGG